ncbi:MAG: ribonuclease HII [Firmicutes bacterium HGW-Firmicutes-14]|nr:MAG: ribonuclease HII [Firmicutes bacterium HGW-Firmicutes-14]
MDLSEKTLGEIKKYLKECGMPLADSILVSLRTDPRQGVKKLYRQVCREQVLAEKERFRLEGMALYETDARAKGYSLIAGVDEAGRGPLAGPVVASAVVFPEGIVIPGIDDSKKLMPSKREYLYNEITGQAVCWSIGLADVQEIDRINILQASLLAMRRALAGLCKTPDYVLVDAVRVSGIDIPQLPIIKGDGKSISIAAASIIAKVTRDRMMDQFDKQFPKYGFSKHKGYGTKAHLQALREYGLSPLHRRSFTGKLFQGAEHGSIW